MPLSNKTTTETKPSRTPFAVVEAYNTIRTNLTFLLSQNNGKIVTISSSNEAEGKSTTSVNIAISFSQLGSRTLLIDSDMRKPTIHKKLHIANTNGLSTVLVGLCEFDDAINSINANLDVLTAGPIPPNPSEILANQSVDAFFEKLREKYDYIIIDTPPINIVTDALVVAPRTDGLVLVVKDYSTYHKNFQTALSALEFANIRLFGVVLNGLITQGAGSKYKYRYKYSYKYRYGYKYGYSQHNDKSRK